MNQRLQKKCLIASAGFHLLLVVILLVGPAFLSANNKAEDRPLLDFVPLRTIDEAFSGGGNPNARPPAAQPQPPASQSQAQSPASQPQQRVEKTEPVKAVEKDPESFSTTPKKKLPNVSMKLTARSNNKTSAKNTNDSTTDSNSQSREVAKRREAFNNATRAIREGVSSSTSIEMPGPGGGGVPYANFLDAVKKIYSDAWIVPDGIADDDAVVSASVTIAKDGDVVSSRITRSSGNTEVDRSVQLTLDRVRTVIALPDSAKESQRTVNIKFSVRAKRGLG